MLSELSTSRDYRLLCVISLAVLCLAPIYAQLFIVNGTQILPGNASQTLTVPGNTKSVDYMYPGERPHWLGAVPPNTPKWVDIPVSSDRITIRSLLFVVAEADWTFSICQDKDFTDCNVSVMRGSSTGWAGDYGYAEAPIPYVDKDGDATPQIHVYVQGADWFSFRAMINYTVN